MPKPAEEIDLNISDPIPNRGRVNIVNSFASNQEQVVTQKKPFQRRKDKEFSS